jgi:hypothetical protein
MAGRTVLASREHALAFHLGFYNQIRQRLLDQIEAYYADSPAEVAEFVERYGIDLLVVNRFATTGATTLAPGVGTSSRTRR